MRSLPFAPGGQLSEVPHVTPLSAMHDADLSEDEGSDLDRRIARRLRDRHVDRYGDELTDDEEEEGEDDEMDAGPLRAHARAGGEDDEEEDDDEVAMAHERRFGRQGAAGMGRSGSQQAAMVLANGHGGANGRSSAFTAGGSSSRGARTANGAGAGTLGHDLASSYIVDRSTGEESSGPWLLDALKPRSARASAKRPKRTFFAQRAAASSAAAAEAAHDLAAAQAAAYYAAASSALNPRSVSVVAHDPSGAAAVRAAAAAAAATLRTSYKANNGHGNGHGSRAHSSAAESAGRPGIWDGQPVDSDDEMMLDGSGAADKARNGRVVA